MMDYDKLYRPARRRLQPDSLHRNYLQREPFMYGSPLSDFMPRKRPSVFRERPLQESLVSTLVNRTRPPLPRMKPITRSMVTEFLEKRREQKKRPDQEEYLPQNLYGSRGGGLRDRRCTSAAGGQRSSTAAPKRISVSAGDERKDFSIIQTLIEEVLPKSSKPGKQQAGKGAKQQKLAWKVKESKEQQAPSSPATSPLKSWPARPASAPFKLSPQNMSPVDLAETLAEKRKNFMRNRPWTAPPQKPMFHLPLSRITNSRQTTRIRPQSSSQKTSGSLVKNDMSSDESRGSLRGLGSSSSSAASPRVTTVTWAEERADQQNTPVSRRSENKLHKTHVSWSSDAGLNNIMPVSGSQSSNNAPGGSEDAIRRRESPISKLCAISSSSSSEDDKSSSRSSISSSSSSTLSSDKASSSSSSSASGFEFEMGGGDIQKTVGKRRQPEKRPGF